MRGTIIRERYAVGDRIGMGGMGVVHVAHDLAYSERVAIKFLHAEHIADGVAAGHMDREAHVGRTCRHPNVVAVRDSGRIDGRPYIVMEHVDGRSLAAAAGDAMFSVARVAHIVAQILSGIAALHRAGFVHGDLKTDNVLVDANDRVKIIDLGLAREHGPGDRDDDLTVSGTPEYVAPEIVEGGAKTIASDLYAIGVILYELLTGTTPFTGATSYEILRRQVEEPVVPPSQRAVGLRLSPRLERVVMKALAKQPAARFGAANEFADALAAAVQAQDRIRATGDHVARAPTEEWTRPDLPVVRPQLAAGTRPPFDVPRVGEPDSLIASALELAGKRMAEHRLAAAASELEAAIDLIDATSTAVPGSWRLLLPLAAVYDGLGDRARARRTARAALDHAACVGSELGQQRAKALLERLAGRVRSLA